MSDEDRYEWFSSGGCQRCDHMEDRFYKTSPPRPHPNCNCTIYDRAEGNSDCDSSDVKYFVTHSGNNHHGPSNPDDEFDMYFDYEITCWGNSDTITGQVVVSKTYGELESEQEIDDFIEEVYADALELVEEIAVNECPVCGDHPHVA